MLKTIFKCTVIWFLVQTTMFAQNHRVGLHLQLPTTTIDFETNDIEELQVFQTGQGKASVMLKVRQPLASQLYAASEENIGKQGLWIWNGRVVSVQKITGPIKNGDVTVHNLTSFEADEFNRISGHR